MFFLLNSSLTWTVEASDSSALGC